MATSSSVLSNTLQSITAAKIVELEKRKQAFEVAKQRVLNEAGQSNDTRARVEILLNGIETLPTSPSQNLQDELKNIRRRLGQAEYDPSFPASKLVEYEKGFLAHLDHCSQKFDLASLYSKLLTEWIESPNVPEWPPDRMDESGSDEAFEVLQDTQKARLEQLRDKFAQVVFEPHPTDQGAITLFLHRLFDGDQGQKALSTLRRGVSEYGKEIWQRNQFFSDQNLKWAIEALLRNDLLHDEKKATLNEFLKDDAVLAEVRDVLNLRYRHLDEWEWNAGDQGIPVMPRQSLNGTWRVMMDEDVLQAIFTQSIGTHWAAQIRELLEENMYATKYWWQNHYNPSLPEAEQMKLQYYLDEKTFRSLMDHNNVANRRQRVYIDNFLLSPLPVHVYSEAKGALDYDGDDDSDEKGKSGRSVKQLLLRTLATEMILRRALDGEVAVVQSDFQWFGTSISHSTIFTLMRFVGFGQDWIDFFRKFLMPPLNLLDGGEVRVRQRGLPMAHIVEKLLGELLLYFMDMAVVQTGAILYRYHDDLWLVGNPAKCAAAWKTMLEFADIMGLEFNTSKTGSVYLTNGERRRDPAILQALPEGSVGMDFLVLDPASGSWIIDREHVQKHVEQLQRQLAGSKSILQWIQTWNSCIRRFFGYTFGEPAHCFGLHHINGILETHREIQKFLFNGETGATVTEHLRWMLQTKFGANSVPDSFMYLPEYMGGLGLKNPFVPLLLLQSNVCKDPEAKMRSVLEAEREAYEEAKKKFGELTERERRRRYQKAFREDGDKDTPAVLSWKDAHTFMSFEEAVRFRELTSTLLHGTYNFFLEQPSVASISAKKITGALTTDFSERDGWELAKQLESEKEALWMLSIFADELFTIFEGLQVADRHLLPISVLKALKSKKVKWQMVL